MTDRLADIDAHIDGVRQLGDVVSAMLGIAAARVQQARGQLAAVDSYTAIIAAAIGRAMALPGSASFLAGQSRSARKHCSALVLFCAEQGFAGAFNERVLDVAGADLTTSELFVIGTRGIVSVRQRGVSPLWTTAMPAHSPGIPKLADIIAGALYARIATGDVDRLDAVFAEWEPARGIQVRRVRMFPVDMGTFALPKAENPPLHQLSPDKLLSELTADYLHAELCRAALHAFAAENEARMEAMAAARSQVERDLATLQATQRQVRQEAITAEIIELAAGQTASRRADSALL